MNPFDLSGPSFLIFYAALGLIVLILIRRRISKAEANLPMPKIDMTDPYEIAYLRGGANEAARIAALSLIDRGLLDLSDRNLKIRDDRALENVRRPIEIAVLNLFTISSPIRTLYKKGVVEQCCRPYRNSMQRDQLISSENIFALRLTPVLVGAFILGGTAGLKIIIAIHRGHYNVVYLTLMAAGFLYYLNMIYNRQRTGLGDRAITDLENLFSGLRDRAWNIKAGGGTNEAALAAAVFGAGTLSPVSFPYIQKLFFKNQSGETGDLGGCGSSCGSSCGGGGCGGGCGGCGGS